MGFAAAEVDRTHSTSHLDTETRIDRDAGATSGFTELFSPDVVNTLRSNRSRVGIDKNKRGKTKGDAAHCFALQEAKGGKRGHCTYR